MTTGDSTIRSVIKTLSWRISGSSATFLVAYLISSNWAMSSTIAVIQLTLNTLLYFIHERIWNKIKWGRLD